MENKASYFKKNFAEFLAKYDEESYEINKIKKAELFEEVKGKVLELGPGTGVNFVFLKNKPIEWIGIEPNQAMHDFLFNKAIKFNIKANLLNCSSEKISIPDNSLDFVISSEVLCSVTDLEQSLKEIFRVLKPKGKFLFIEHVVDKHNLLRKFIQKTVPYTPWKLYSDGCRPGRDIEFSINQTGFTKVNLTNYMQEGKGLISLINKPHIYGWAIK